LGQTVENQLDGPNRYAVWMISNGFPVICSFSGPASYRNVAPGNQATLYNEGCKT